MRPEGTGISVTFIFLPSRTQTICTHCEQTIKRRPQLYPELLIWQETILENCLILFKPNPRERRFPVQSRRLRPDQPVGRTLGCPARKCYWLRGSVMTYSYTQIKQ